MLFALKIKPNAKKNEIIRDAQGNFKVKIKAPPVDGKANKELINFLSEIFNVPKSHIEIVSGETSPNKRVRIIGDEEQLKTILPRQNFTNKTENNV